MISEQTGIEAEAVPGGKGQFDVLSDGTLIFSKTESGRFPEAREILVLLR